MQNAPREHSAKLLTFIKLPFVLKAFVCLFLSSRLRQVLLCLLLRQRIEDKKKTKTNNVAALERTNTLCLVGPLLWVNFYSTMYEHNENKDKKGLLLFCRNGKMTDLSGTLLRRAISKTSLLTPQLFGTLN